MAKSKNRRKGRSQPVPPAVPKTPPKTRRGPSPTWYVWTMFGLMLVGSLLIVLNYVTVIPGSPSNAYLFIGLTGIAVGFAMTTNYR